MADNRFYGTGPQKERDCPRLAGILASGNITVNKRELSEYFWQKDPGR